MNMETQNVKNVKTSRQSTLEKDINDLFDRIKKEKELKEHFIEVLNSEGKIIHSYASTDSVEDKNYSDYRKLIDSLSKLYNTYKQLRIVESNYNCDKNNFILELLEKLEIEIDIIHNIMIESLKCERDNQYRCLSDCYIKLINLVDNIERNKPIVK